MKAQKILDSQSNPEEKNQWRNQAPYCQTVLQTSVIKNQYDTGAETEI